MGQYCELLPNRIHMRSIFFGCLRRFHHRSMVRLRTSGVGRASPHPLQSLCRGLVPLARRLAIPVAGGGLVARRAAARQVAIGERELGLDHTAFRRLVEPRKGLFGVGGAALAVHGHHREIELREAMAHPGGDLATQERAGNPSARPSRWNRSPGFPAAAKE